MSLFGVWGPYPRTQKVRVSLCVYKTGGKSPEIFPLLLTTVWVTRSFAYIPPATPIAVVTTYLRQRNDVRASQKLVTVYYTRVSAHVKFFNARKSFLFFSACMQHRMSIHQTISTDHGELFAYWDLQNKIENSKKEIPRCPLEPNFDFFEFSILFCKSQ